MARIDYYTQTAEKQEYFSDFLSSFDKSPMSSDLARVVNENSVKQSVKNIILTNLGERLFSPNIGGNLSKILFEPLNGFTADDLQRDITHTIKYNEPRVSQENLAVTVSPSDDENTVAITIEFYIINDNIPQSLNLIVQRVR